MFRLAHVVLLASSLVWLISLWVEPLMQFEEAAFFVSLAIISANGIASLCTLTWKRKILISLNCIQIVLFGVLNHQLFCVFGEQHFRSDREPCAYDWIEFSGAHLLRAADLLDGLDEYGIDLQNIKHNSTEAALLLIWMHLTVDVFLISLVLTCIRRWWIKNAHPETWLARERREFLWLLTALTLYVGFALLQGLQPRDWFLWPVDNLLRLVDVGDAFQLFGWKLHSVEPNYWTRGAAIAFRFAASVWITRNLLFLRATVFATWGLGVEELTSLLEDHDAHVRSGAAKGLGRSGRDASVALSKLARAVVKDVDPSVRRNAAWALGQIAPTVPDAPELDDAVEALANAVFDRDRELRLEASKSLGQIGANARTALGSLSQLLRVSQSDKEDKETVAVVTQALAQISRGWRQQQTSASAEVLNGHVSMQVVGKREKK
jgi:HEAT repeats